MGFRLSFAGLRMIRRLVSTLHEPQQRYTLNRSLLIVDDDADQLSILSFWFSQRGYRVATADHPRQALVAARGGRFQVAIVDASLPEIDGLELMKRLMRSQNDMQVIILSGYDFAEYDSPEHGATADSAFACLVKPCDLRLLETKVEEAFNQFAEAAPYQETFDSQFDLRFGVHVGA